MSANAIRDGFGNIIFIEGEGAGTPDSPFVPTIANGTATASIAQIDAYGNLFYRGATGAGTVDNPYVLIEGGSASTGSATDAFPSLQVLASDWATAGDVYNALFSGIGPLADYAAIIAAGFLLRVTLFRPSASPKEYFSIRVLEGGIVEWDSPPLSGDITDETVYVVAVDLKPSSLLSSDANNALTIGTDGKLFYEPLAVVDPGGGSLPYSRWSAVLNQSGTDAPSMNVSINDLLLEVAAGYSSPGSYTLTFPEGVLSTSDHAEAWVSGNTVSGFPFYQTWMSAFVSGDIVYVSTTKFDGVTLEAADSVLYSGYIEVRIYPVPLP